MFFLQCLGFYLEELEAARISNSRDSESMKLSSSKHTGRSADVNQLPYWFNVWNVWILIIDSLNPFWTLAKAYLTEIGCSAFGLVLRCFLAGFGHNLHASACSPTRPQGSNSSSRSSATRLRMAWLQGAVSKFGRAIWGQNGCVNTFHVFHVWKNIYLNK